MLAHTTPSAAPHRLCVVPVGSDPELDLFWNASNDAPFSMDMTGGSGMTYTLSRAGGKDTPVVCTMVMPSGAHVSGSIEYILGLIEASRNLN